MGRTMQMLARAGSFHAEFVADAKAEEEEESCAEDGLEGGQRNRAPRADN